MFSVNAAQSSPSSVCKCCHFLSRCRWNTSVYAFARIADLLCNVHVRPNQPPCRASFSKANSRNGLVFRSAMSPTVSVDSVCIGRSFPWSYIYGASKSCRRRERGQCMTVSNFFPLIVLAFTLDFSKIGACTLC